MAELPRYRRDRLLGVISPQYQGVALQQAARASGTLAEAMDRVSRAAFAEAEQQAKIEGIEYGAANAPTVEQLAKAKASGQDVSELLPGDQFTVFGSNARAAAIDLVTATIETEARESLSAAQTMYELGRMDIGQLQTKIATIEDSYSAVLADISPAASAKFRATIGLAGNSVFLSAAKAKIKQDKEELQAQLANGAQGMIDSVETIYSAGVTVAPDGSVITPQDSIDVLRAEIMKFGSMVENGDTFVRENLRLLDKKNEEVLVANISGWVAEDPIKRERELRTGAVTDQNIAQIIADLPSDKRQLVVKAANESLSRDLSRENQLSQRNERIRSEKFDALTGDLFRAKSEGNDIQMEEILSRMDLLDEDRATALRESAYTTGGLDNAETIQGYDLLATQGELTLELINTARTDKKISESTYRRYLGAIEQQRKTDHQDAMTIAENTLRPGVRSLINPGDDDRKALKKLGEIENAMINEARRNPDFDRIDFVQQKLAQDSGPSAQELTTARNKLSGLAQLFSLPADTPPSELKQELDRRVSNGQFNATQASAYTSAFNILGVE